MTPPKKLRREERKAADKANKKKRKVFEHSTCNEVKEENVIETDKLKSLSPMSEQEAQDFRQMKKYIEEILRIKIESSCQTVADLRVVIKNAYQARRDVGTKELLVELVEGLLRADRQNEKEETKIRESAEDLEIKIESEATEFEEPEEEIFSEETQYRESEKIEIRDFEETENRELEPDEQLELEGDQVTDGPADAEEDGEGESSARQELSPNFFEEFNSNLVEPSESNLNFDEKHFSEINKLEEEELREGEVSTTLDRWKPFRNKDLQIRKTILGIKTFFAQKKSEIFKKHELGISPTEDAPEKQQTGFEEDKAEQPQVSSSRVDGNDLRLPSETTPVTGNLDFKTSNLVKSPTSKSSATFVSLPWRPAKRLAADTEEQLFRIPNQRKKGRDKTGTKIDWTSKHRVKLGVSFNLGRPPDISNKIKEVKTRDEDGLGPLEPTGEQKEEERSRRRSRLFREKLFLAFNNFINCAAKSSSDERRNPVRNAEGFSRVLTENDKPEGSPSESRSIAAGIVDEKRRKPKPRRNSEPADKVRKK